MKNCFSHMNSLTCWYHYLILCFYTWSFYDTLFYFILFLLFFDIKLLQQIYETFDDSF